MAEIWLRNGEANSPTTVTDYNPFPVKTVGPDGVDASVKPSTPTQSSPQLTSASAVILAANANRLGVTIWNEGAAVAYIKLGTNASTTSYSVQIASGAYYELPFRYVGEIDGVTSSSTAQLRVTELTA